MSSLNPEDSRRRGRSKSPGRRDDDRDDDRDRSRLRGGEEVVRERSRSRVMIERPPSPPSARYNDRDRYEYAEETTVRASKGGRDKGEVRYASAKKYYDDDNDDFHERRPGYSIPGEFKEVEVEKDVKVRYGDRQEKEYYEERKYSRKDEYEPPSSHAAERYAKPSPRGYDSDDSDSGDSRLYEDDPKTKDLKSLSSFNFAANFSRGRGDPPTREHGRKESLPYPHEPPSFRRDSPPFRRGSPPRRRESSPPPPRRESPSPPRRRQSPPPRHSSPPSRAESPLTRLESPPHGRSYAQPKKWEYAQPDEKVTYSQKETYTSRPAESRSSQSKVVTVEPGQRRAGSDSLGPRMGSLTVSSGHTQSLSLSAAPGSPLLEAYHGTYQSISPMPSPLMISAGLHASDADIPDLAPLSPTTSRRRHARFYDAAADATALAKALKGNRSPDVDPLVEILPALTHDQIIDLRVEYKKIVKTGSEKKGVNIAKHIKLRLKEEEGPLLKACYTVALGQWESEAYWANFWYQGEKSRRELLIESLMGRTNAEIRAIKDGFSDKKYSDSLVKCMKMELKEDKFKKAVLLVLEEKRMEERPGYSLDRKLIEEDVRELRRAVKAEKGGESTMINIIVLRSDSHIREILRVYEASFHSNFAREMLKKSGNLVGELLAHILNGVINRPVRDALLLNHALTLTKSDSLRAELLISRLVRYHWDRAHMEAVKREYRTRYGRELQQAVRDGTKGAWGEFCEELCVKRMPDDVKRVERVERVEAASFRLG